jgi:hypothetical protein
MAIRRCRFCHEMLRGEPEEIGARCPHCRRAIYERSDDHPIPVAEPVDRDVCVIHATSTAIGTCPRCGNFICEVCRTRWRDRWLCVACVERALSQREAAPEEQRAHRRQAILSFVFGALTWLAAALGIALLIFGARQDQFEAMVVRMVMVLVVLVAGLVGAALGLAQGIAAIRVRGDHMILATAGVLLCGLYAGMMIGFLSVQVWQD